MWPFKRKNEAEKKRFVKELIRYGKIKKEDEQKVLDELLNTDIRVDSGNTCKWK